MRRSAGRLWLMCTLAASLTAGSGAAAPAAPAAPRPTPPAVDLGRLRVTDAGATAPIRAGGTAVLTLDPALQRAADRLLTEANPRAGAVVAVDARTGRVLAWSSRGLGNAGITGTRAPSASLFKIVTTAALLELSEVHPATRVCSAGGSSGLERRHLEPPRGEADVQCHPFWQALGHSRNAVFAQLVTQHLLRTDLLAMAERFGFGGMVPFDVPAPVGHLEVPYNDLSFARTATGFENSNLSPLGALELAFVVAAGGRQPRLHIVAQAGDYEAPPRLEFAGRVMDERTAANLRWMMEVTINQGTSAETFRTEEGRPYLFNLQAAGKTGTLQPHAVDPTTTWFVGFAPSKSPRLVVSVLLENGRVWRRKANELGRDLFRAYFAERGFRGIASPFPDE